MFGQFQLAWSGMVGGWMGGWSHSDYKAYLISSWNGLKLKLSLVKLQKRIF